jgi:hypothetical protein
MSAAFFNDDLGRQDDKIRKIFKSIFKMNPE